MPKLEVKLNEWEDTLKRLVKKDEEFSMRYTFLKLKIQSLDFKIQSGIASPLGQGLKKTIK
jgi:hypothetical protein